MHIAKFQVLSALLVLSACGQGESEPPATAGKESPTEVATIQVDGTVEVPIDFLAVRAKRPVIGQTACRGYASDITAGTQVTILDATGATVGLAELEPGLLGGRGGDKLGESPCTFGFAIDDVPTGGGFYTIKVGSRDGLTFEESELATEVRLILDR